MIIDKEKIELPQGQVFQDFNDHIWYSPDYVREMCSRWYNKGLKEGRAEPIIHFAQIESCSKCSDLNQL